MKRVLFLKRLLLLAFLIHFSSACLAQVTETWRQVYGDLLWGYSYPTAMALDDSGNVYVTGIGRAATVAVTWEYATIKYNSDGVQLWVATYDGPGFDLAQDIAVDKLGNVYVTGESENASEQGNFDYVTIKYNSVGIQQWVAIYDGPAKDDDKATALALDDSRNVYVTGASWGIGTEMDYATIKYNPDGVPQWVRRFNGTFNRWDRAIDIVVDDLKNVYVTGETEARASIFDMATIKYNSSGVRQWLNIYNGPDSLDDRGKCLAVDPRGKYVIVAGFSTSAATRQDYTILRYGSTGTLEWLAIYNGPGNGNDEINSLVMDPAGKIYVTGGSIGAGTFQDYATLKYSPSGILLWESRYNGTGDGPKKAYDLALDRAGDVYVTGSSVNFPDRTDMFSDIVTVKYNALGTQQWVQTYDGGLRDKGYAIAVDSSFGVYVAGITRRARGERYITIKYSQPFSSPPPLSEAAVWELERIKPSAFRVFNFPNPVSTTTRIQYELPFDGRVSVKIFDVLGNELATLVNADKQAGNHSTEFNAASLEKGVYYYTVTVQTEKDLFKRSGKITVVK